MVVLEQTVVARRALASSLSPGAELIIRLPQLHELGKLLTPLQYSYLALSTRPQDNFIVNELSGNSAKAYNHSFLYFHYSINSFFCKKVYW